MRNGVLIGLLFALTAHAQVAATAAAADTPIREACTAVAATPLPLEIAGAITPESYPTCDSYALYAKQDFAAARTCATGERAALLAHAPGSPNVISETPPLDDESDKIVGGMVVLTELYANGEGVQRNSAAAARFFCEAVRNGEVSSDPYFMADELAILKRLRQPGPTDAALHFCPGDSLPPKGIPQTRYCVQREQEEHAAMHAGGIQEGIDAAQKDSDDADAAIAPLLKKLTLTQRTAYGKAEAAMQHFIDVQVTGDYLFMGGYGSGGLYPNEEHAAFEQQMIEFLKQRPAIPAPAAARAADDALNKVYGQLIAAAAPLEGMPASFKPSYAITPEGLRGEQRAWLAYRDAFIAFGRTLQPDLPREAWQMPLTKARVDDLKTFYEGNGASYTEAAQKYTGWRERAAASTNAEADEGRQSVAEVLDHLTPTQQAAWLRVQSALSAFVAAHAASLPHPDPTFPGQQLRALYGELYAVQYNKTHGFLPDRAKAAEGFAKNDAALNTEYRADLASTCVFRPARGEPPTAHRTPEGLRSEQRAWLALRDAWVTFLAGVYPEESRDALGNMFTGSRAFELQMLHKNCERTP